MINKKTSIVLINVYFFTCRCCHTIASADLHLGRRPLLLWWLMTVVILGSALLFMRHGQILISGLEAAGVIWWMRAGSRLGIRSRLVYQMRERMRRSTWLSLVQLQFSYSLCLDYAPLRFRLFPPLRFHRCLKCFFLRSFYFNFLVLIFCFVFLRIVQIFYLFVFITF